MNKVLKESFFSNVFFLFVQIRRILFAGKFYIFLILAITWDFVIVIISHISHESMAIESVFNAMNLVPMMILALYLSMTLVPYEKENMTIEALFSVPGSPYKVWSYKLAVQFITLLFVLILLALISFFFMEDFAIEVMVSHAFVPVFFAANLNFFLSTQFKSGYAAGLITLVLLLSFIPLSNFLESSSWNFYLNPFDKPDNLDIDIWNQRLLYNKLGIFGLGLMFMYLGLSKLRYREPFI